MYINTRTPALGSAAASLSSPIGFGAVVSVENPGGGPRCEASERRIRPIVEAPPSTLVSVAPVHLADPRRRILLRPDAYAAYSLLKAAAEAAGLGPALLRITSGFRNIAHQRRLWERALQRHGTPEIARRWVAPPGGSSHHTGRTIDVTLGPIKNDSSNVALLRQTPTYRWLVCNAARFGFFPYAREPWHWEFNPPAATASGGSANLGMFGEPAALRPVDVAVEMVNRTFRLSGPLVAGASTLPAGAAVVPQSWDNTLPDVPIRRGAASANAPKVLLRPVAAVVAGIAPYSKGIDGQAAAVVRRERAVNDWISRGTAQRTTGTPLFGRELTRLKGLLSNSRGALNEFLILETMYNRFDADIRQWVDHYNTQFRFTGAQALDPNLVKSMIFQETRMGTSGRHLEVPPTHIVKTRFNLMQVVDSSGSALLIMIHEMQPALIASRHLTHLSRDLGSAQRERARLRAARTRTAADNARLTELNRLAGQSWEVFIWGYREAGQTDGFHAAVNDFFASVAAGARPRNEDYAFWIRAGVRWLFEKRAPRSITSWPEAVRAFNGGGRAADTYRDAVVNRARDAVAAQRARRAFVPRD